MKDNISFYCYNVRDKQDLPQGWYSIHDIQQLDSIVNGCITPYALVADAALLDHIDVEYASNTLHTGDMTHCGLSFGSDSFFQPLQVTALSWFFLGMPPDMKSVNWKASFHLFIVKVDSWKKLGGISKSFFSMDVRVMDLAYRMLRSGGEVFYDPLLLRSKPPDFLKVASLNQHDCFLFAYQNLHKRSALTWMFYEMSHSFKWLSLYQSYRNALASPKPEKVFARNEKWEIIKDCQLKSIKTYSAIIPTLDRYEYLPGAIESLLKQPMPPTEIIIYDQTDKGKRITTVYDGFDKNVVKVIYSDEKGQSSARNNALKHTTQEWCLLFDDDSIALPDMVSNHIYLLEHSEYSISTGASLAPGQQFSDLPYTIDFFHLADVLDTGNCFIHKAVLRDAGFFDLAFNRGPGADNDLGTRLHLKGYGIVFNPKAIRIHYKATTGGLRTFGVWWRFKTTVMGAYPPPSQTYTIQKYYPRKFWKHLYFRFFLKAGYRQNFWQLILLWLFFPVKLYRSLQAAKKLKELNKVRQ